MLSDRNFNWTAPTPSFEPWSGVRESDYALDDAFAFAGAGQKEAPPPEPFTFIYQLAFTSPPFANMSGPWSDASDKTDWEDKDPWLFDESELHILPSVLELIAKDPAKQDTFAVMREFVWMQRLFRAALAGRLGKQFPVETLPRLAQETAGSVEPQRTLRWNVRTAPELSFLMRLKLRDYKTLNKSARDRVDACLKKIEFDPEKTMRAREIDALSKVRAKLYALSDEEWEKSCVFKDASSEVVAESAQVNQLRKLRHAMGLREDEALASRPSRCQPL